MSEWPHRCVDTPSAPASLRDHPACHLTGEAAAYHMHLLHSWPSSTRGRHCPENQLHKCWSESDHMLQLSLRSGLLWASSCHAFMGVCLLWSASHLCLAISCDRREAVCVQWIQQLMFIMCRLSVTVPGLDYSCLCSCNQLPQASLVRNHTVSG